MKEGWDYKKLGEVCEILDSRRKPITKNKRESGTIPYYGATGILDYVKDYIFDEKLVLLGEDGAKWGAGENSAYIVEGKTWINNHAHALRPKRELIIDELLVYYLNFANLQPFITGVTVPKLNQEKMRSIEIPVPPLSEQQSIVDYLDSAFAKIDAMKANAEKALNEAKALFQASLKKMLEPKDGWEEKTLGDICSDIRYGTSTPSNENGEYKYLRMNNITNDGFLDVSHYKTITLPEKELEKCLVKKGDIIFNRTNSRELVGKSCVFTEEEKMVIAGYLIRIRLKEGFEPQFITYNMNLQRSLGFFQHLIVGAVHQANISANNIQKVIINHPILSEQQSIVTSLDSLKSKVDRLQDNFDKISQECDALKQAIFRQVFE